MLFSGYLKAYDPILTPEDLTEYTLQVPNREVKTVFRTIIQSWIDGGPGEERPPRTDAASPGRKQYADLPTAVERFCGKYAFLL